MSEQKGILDDLSLTARLVLATVLLLILAVAFYFDVPVGFWAFFGPLLIVDIWMGQRIGKHTRTENPGVFWGMLGLLVITTCYSIYAINQRLAGAAL